jgi:hypothetical protein
MAGQLAYRATPDALVLLRYPGGTPAPCVQTVCVMKNTDHPELGSSGGRRIFTTDVAASSMRRAGFGIFQREWHDPHPVAGGD